MKALLTSGGIANPTIEAELWRLLGGARAGLKLLFVTTASNYEAGEKSWLLADLQKFLDLGFVVDIIDVTGLPKANWLPRFQWADAYFFEGGSTGWLMRQIRQSGLAAELPKLLESRLYMGASAGSVVLCPTICNPVQDLFDEDDLSIAGTPEGLGLVDFDFVPHLNSGYFARVTTEQVRDAAAGPTIAVDDHGAVAIDGSMIKVIGEGEVLELNRG